MKIQNTKRFGLRVLNTLKCLSCPCLYSWVLNVKRTDGFVTICCSQNTNNKLLLGGACWNLSALTTFGKRCFSFKIKGILIPDLQRVTKFSLNTVYLNFLKYSSLCNLILRNTSLSRHDWNHFVCWLRAKWKRLDLGTAWARLNILLMSHLSSWSPNFCRENKF